MTEREEIGRRVADARRGTGLSQQRLADATDINRSAIADVERGVRNITATELVALAKALGTSVGWFVGEEQGGGLEPVRGFRWEEWAVQVHFPRGVTTVEHECEEEARFHCRQLLREPVQRGERIEVVRRVHVQGDWIPAPADDQSGAATPNPSAQEQT